LTLDEKLEKFRDRCSFKQYIPSKPGKYGIKVFCLADAKMYYTVNLEIYAGKQPDGPHQVSNSPKDVVLRLTDCVANSGRNITTDNWFTSYELAKELLNKRITLVGTIRKNKKQIPTEFVTCKSMSLKSSKFGFHESITLVSYKAKLNKNVLTMSTLHHDNSIDPDTGDNKKPEVLTFYNSTKYGVDMVDKMSALYSCARNTRRWPVVIFYSLLNIAGINAQIIYNSNNIKDKTLKRRQFLRNLALSLTDDYLKLRVNAKNIPRNLKRKVMDIATCEESTNATTSGEDPIGRKRCHMCTRKENRMTRKFCHKCKKFICLKHGKLICENCV
jgi:hypothetical protein